MIIRKINKLFNIFTNNIWQKSNIVFIVDSANWATRFTSQGVISGLQRTMGIKIPLLESPYLLRNKIIHFGAVNTLISSANRISIPHSSNKIALSWFHITPNDPRLNLIGKLNKIVDIVHTSCSITRSELIRNGFSPQKIVMIPIGVDLSIFKPCDKEEKKHIKKKIGLPEDKFIIGSFQKDGNGWREGLEPKLIKGPDIFCDCIERLSKKYPLHILLTGPARGYVKKRLISKGIGYTHCFLKHYSDIVNYYNALDIYLLTSRVEGGPQSILESMACKIPLVSTNMGMAADILTDNENVLITEVEDVAGLVQKSSLLLEDGGVRERLINNAFDHAQKFDWKKIGRRYYDEIYSKLI